MAEKIGREERERGGKNIGIKKRTIIGRQRASFLFSNLSLPQEIKGGRVRMEVVKKK